MKILKQARAIARNRLLHISSSIGVQRLAITLLFFSSFVFPLLDRNARDIDAVTNAGIYVVLALGLNLVVGFAGLLDIGYAAFFAIGAYTYGILASAQLRPIWSDAWIPLETIGFVTRMSQTGNLPDLVRFQFNFWIMLPISALLAAGFGVLFGAPTLRLKGDYLAIVTLAFGEIIPVIVRNIPPITGGAAGLTGVRTPSLFGFRFAFNPVPYYYLVLGEVLLVIFIVTRLKYSRTGRAWRAIREDQLAADCLGVNPVHFKLLAFGMGAALASVAGTTLVSKLTTATPEMFRLPVSIGILAMVILGGMGSIPGIIVGAILLSILQSVVLQEMTIWVQSLGKLLGNAWLAKLQLIRAIDLIYGIILVLMMLYRKQGLIPEAVRLAALRPDELQATPKRGHKIRLALRAENDLTDKQVTLAVQRLSKRFGGVMAANEIDLVVRPGEILSVIGPNGSGKTTLFNMITGVVPSDSGRIVFEGKDITSMPSHRIAAMGIARTFQTLRLFGSMTVLENLLVAQHARLRSSAVSSIVRPPAVIAEEHAAIEWAKEVLAIFENRLLPRANHIASSLSYANRRRLEIARALAMRPSLLLLDEPTAGMNPAETLELMEQIRGLRDLGLTIILIEHKLQVVMNVSRRVLVLDYGRKIAEGTPEMVWEDENVIQAYLGRRGRVAKA